MPKDDIDYSNTIFYKIYCTNNSVSDIYVGHTTNFVQRKYYHKRACNNDRDSNHNLKVYKFIRSNGGWNNWRMDIIGFHDCDDHYQARKVEQQYFESLNATLNSIAPLPKPKEHVKKEKKEKRIWQCEVCNIVCHTEKKFNIHNETKKHKQLESGNTCNDIKSNISKVFSCSDCDYSTSNYKDYKKHLRTKKHLSTKSTTLATKTILNKNFICENCGKEYRDRSGLWRHKRNCVTISSEYKELKKPSSLDDYKALLLLTIEQLNKKDELVKSLINKINTDIKIE